MADAQKSPTRRRKPVQARSQQTVAAILEAAARIFERGSATTNAIARLAGVSIGSLYEYFPNKDAILESLVDRHVADAVARLQRELRAHPPQSTPLDQGVRRLVALMLELHADRPGLHRTLVGWAMGMPAVQRRLLEAEGRMREPIVAWLRAHPEVRVPDVTVAGRVVTQGTDALVHRYVEDDEGIEPDVFETEVTRLWVGYLQGG
ncbi:TetR/AcrR family transcriptional regulator [Paraliomyxa miuraensis]|uniref:TetR/AcrR family transcriptional regulator n=1 Tax=Paraliomyxa miuraensis TaxID=376150 RepID=UPI0022592D57|nr:TetR/AcrR family transcriptional regulator [Paraliomyxa miuraensis]MCX4240351.1 TetR/AcrR family transcriptional regulator [Paraliomyxa miuraensis]